MYVCMEENNRKISLALYIRLEFSFEPYYGEVEVYKKNAKLTHTTLVTIDVNLLL